jgi:hypothetical protein
MRYFIDGRAVAAELVERDQLIESCAARCAADPGDGEVAVFVFSKPDHFHAWHRTMPFGPKLEAALEAVAKVQELEGTDHALALARQRALTERALADIHELARRLGLPVDSLELFMAAHRGASLLEPPVLHSALLYDNRDCTGDIHPVISGVPYVTLGSFNNVASSARVVGSLAVWPRTWFRGTPAYFIGVGVGPCFRFAWTHSNNVESAYSF